MQFMLRSSTCYQFGASWIVRDVIGQPEEGSILLKGDTLPPIVMEASVLHSINNFPFYYLYIWARTEVQLNELAPVVAWLNRACKRPDRMSSEHTFYPNRPSWRHRKLFYNKIQTLAGRILSEDRGALKHVILSPVAASLPGSGVTSQRIIIFFDEALLLATLC